MPSRGLFRRAVLLITLLLVGLFGVAALVISTDTADEPGDDEASPLPESHTEDGSVSAAIAPFPAVTPTTEAPAPPPPASAVNGARGQNGMGALGTDGGLNGGAQSFAFTLCNANILNGSFSVLGTGAACDGTNSYFVVQFG